ncbi:MAG: hypothetical protein RIM72_07980 [Alphaproteobacteria bacterium]
MNVKAARDSVRHRHSLIWGMAILLLAAALLGGCGKKADPEAPDPESSYPQTYPSE